MKQAIVWIFTYVTWSAIVWDAIFKITRFNCIASSKCDLRHGKEYVPCLYATAISIGDVNMDACRDKCWVWDYSHSHWTTECRRIKLVGPDQSHHVRKVNHISPGCQLEQLNTLKRDRHWMYCVDIDNVRNKHSECQLFNATCQVS